MLQQRQSVPWGSFLTGHLGGCHECVLRDGVGALAWQANVRVSRGNVDNHTTANVSRAVAASPGLGFLLEHCSDLCLYTEEISAGVDIHYAVKIVHVSLSNGCMNAVVDLHRQLFAIRVQLAWEVGEAYSGSIDGVVKTSELLDHKVNHSLDGVVVLNVHFKNCGLVLLITGVLLALL